MNPFQRQIKLLSQPRLFESMCNQEMQPLTADVHPTLLCASECKNCVCAPYLGKGATLTPDDMEKAVEDFKALGVQAITITGGGEPLMAAPALLYPMLNSGMSLGMNTSLSCGQLGIETLLKNIDRFTWVRVSFDAFDEWSYRRRRAYHKFDKVMERLRLLLEVRKPKTTIGLGVLIDQEILDNLGTLLNTLADEIPSVLRGRIGYILLRPYIRHFSTDSIDYSYINQLATEFPTWVKAFGAEGFALIAHTEKFEEISTIENQQKKRESLYCYGSAVNLVLGADGFYYRCCERAYQLDSRVAHVGALPERIIQKYRDWLYCSIVDCPLYCKHHITNEFIQTVLSYDSPHKDFF